ncbi:D-amino acid dehydrogenase [Hydrocarboniphaga sp.]|uniref:D-amino acid dehydrogenase n=1 Tax=Hydrocarboniphaga sp. TaxID=2033016 RepID=UPI002ABC52B5|nr:D-amino acid dehydrogenase [Hydrocarboniphaga sp.]MDZ4076889.1 D-amino acid dehydrogenase [Hydrocarboniphaga sp.]
MKIIVMGAGVLGVTSAWYLSKAGHEVVVLDRNAGPARETSFGNGGQISVSHAEPWANPSAPLKLLRWLGKEDAPLLFRFRADPSQWAWGLKFLRECGAARTRRNMAQLVRLGTYSRESLQALRAETGLEYEHLERGILHYYTGAKEFDAALAAARVMRELGCERRVIDNDELLRIEPALAHIRPKLAGATYTSADESGDAYLFTNRLAALCEQRGVRFRFGVRLQRLHRQDDRLVGVELADENGAYQLERADAYVLALGSFSPQLAKTAGVSLDIYPVKGYSLTLPIADPAKAPTISLTDEAHKIVFSRFGDRLRIAGTAEFNGYSMQLNAVRCKALLDRTLEVFPGVAEPEHARFWTGLRPATPGNVPYVGRSAVRNLYLNTGHGTLGWTHACGSGRAVAEIVDGRVPDCDFEFMGVGRGSQSAVAAT